MAKAQFIFGFADPARRDSNAPALLAGTITQETLEADGTTTLTAPSSNTSKPLCRVVVDAAAWVALGTTPNTSATSPTSATTPKILMNTGAEAYFYVEPGWKAAVDFI